MQIWQIPICNRSRDTIWRFAVKIQYENHLKANFSVKNCFFAPFKILHSFDFVQAQFSFGGTFSFPLSSLPLLSYISICLTFYIHLRWLRRSSFHCEYDAHCQANSKRPSTLIFKIAFYCSKQSSPEGIKVHLTAADNCQSPENK